MFGRELVERLNPVVGRISNADSPPRRMWRDAHYISTIRADVDGSHIPTVDPMISVAAHVQVDAASRSPVESDCFVSPRRVCHIG